MTDSPSAFAFVRLVMSVLWLCVSIIMIKNPRRLFTILNYGRTPAISDRGVRFFRILGVANLIGSVPMIIFFARLAREY